MAVQMYKSLDRCGGYTLGEMAIVLAVISCLSVALFHGARVGVRSMNLYTAQKQATGLAQLMKVDFELAGATKNITSLTDFFGILYTRQWPVEANSIFGSSNGGSIDLRGLVLDERGCVQASMALKPCWSASEGIRVELYDANAATLISVVRPSVMSSDTRALVGLGMDAIMVQNHYFQQHSTWSELNLEEAGEEGRAQGRSRRQSEGQAQ